MKIQALQNFLSSYQSEAVVLSYYGYISDRIFNDLSESLRGIIENEPRIGKKGRAVFSLFVEQTQNLIYYSADRLEMHDGTEAGRGGVFISINGEERIVSAISYVKKESVEHLRGKLEKVLTMSQEEIREAYRAQLMGDIEETSRGAGLGFLEIARHCSKPFEFVLEDAADGTYIFSFSATV